MSHIKYTVCQETVSPEKSTNGYCTRNVLFSRTHCIRLCLFKISLIRSFVHSYICIGLLDVARRSHCEVIDDITSKFIVHNFIFESDSWKAYWQNCLFSLNYIVLFFLGRGFEPCVCLDLFSTTLLLLPLLHHLFQLNVLSIDIVYNEPFRAFHRCWRFCFSWPILPSGKYQASWQRREFVLRQFIALTKQNDIFYDLSPIVNFVLISIFSWLIRNCTARGGWIWSTFYT